MRTIAAVAWEFVEPLYGVEHFTQRTKLKRAIRDELKHLGYRLQHSGLNWYRLTHEEWPEPYYGTLVEVCRLVTELHLTPRSNAA